MAKVTTTDLASLENQTTAIAQINANFEAIEAAIELLLSRDGTSPNAMEADLDLNGNRLLNLPSPAGANDPVRLVDLQSATVGEGLVVPDLSGNDGKNLSNDGSVLLWSDAGSGDMLGANNLSDVDSAATSRSNLGLGTAAQANTGTSGAMVPLLNGANTWSGTQVYSALGTFSGGFTVSGTVEPRLSSTTLTTISTDSIGYRGLGPPGTQDGNYTFVLNDAGTAVCHTSGSAHAYTIPPNIFPVNTVLTVRNRGAGVVTLTRGSGVTLRPDNSSSNMNLALAQWGTVTLWQEATNVWVALGSGLS